MSLPAFNAASKSPDIPMLKISRLELSSPHLSSASGYVAFKYRSKTSLVSLSLSKSAFFSVSDAARESSRAPMVINPSRRSFGHSFNKCPASKTSSEFSSDEESVRGGIPDFESSPEVLIWIRTRRGEVRSVGRALFRAVAALIELNVCILYRLGIASRSSG